MIYKDQMMREVRISHPPSRIVCLVPSITELLVDLGLEKQIAGITRFCVHPAHLLTQKVIIGGTKNVKADIVRSLQPDLIVANKEENLKSDIEALESEFTVWMSDISDLNDAIEMITELGKITNTDAAATSLMGEIKKGFNTLNHFKGKSALYLIWRKPYMAAGKGTFIHDLMMRCGLQNAAAHIERYPELSSNAIEELNPDYIFLSSEPYPFKEKHIQEIKEINPHSIVVPVDGEYFSWYGSRLAKAPAYFNSLYHTLNPS